jgi:hypothetical protein
MEEEKIQGQTGEQEKTVLNMIITYSDGVTIFGHYLSDRALNAVKYIEGARERVASRPSWWRDEFDLTYTRSDNPIAPFRRDGDFIIKEVESYKEVIKCTDMAINLDKLLQGMCLPGSNDYEYYDFDKESEVVESNI